ncbi:tyrosine-type recombinase/integrase [Brevibacillus choshinensis]|uniref:Tyrosine-type recombinase/integrase n=1 Tax=Brevibacillus choshinensis TaxID=54911 RepID=A0ABX7FH80_BRECH|nr:tyrosine-type recombinase/integrase [Brevibacillus choshinensis]QRG65568.1 tyrosine-type recombinase/integrase [Brevibacillus choshinensis]
MRTYMLPEDVGYKEKQHSYPEQMINIIDLFHSHEISKEGTNSFEGDAWDLTVLAGTSKSRVKGAFTVKFDSFQDWSKPFCKAFIAHLLFKKYSPTTLVRNTLELKSFYWFLRDYYPEMTSIYEINESVIQGYIHYLISMEKVDHYKQRRYAVLEFFFSWLKKVFKEDFDFPVLPKQPFKDDSIRSKTMMDEEEKAVPFEVCQQIMKAVGVEEDLLKKKIECSNKRWEKNKNWRPKPTHSFKKRHLLYCQVLKLLMATGRRISHILDLSSTPLLEGRDNDADGVWMVWDETKTGQGHQKVFIPEPLATIVRESIGICLELSEDYRERADDKYRDMLFLSDFGPTRISPLTQTGFRNFLNGGYTSGVPFVERYSIRHNGELYRIKSHGFRHTRATQLALGGAGLGTIQHDLAHNSEIMTNRYINGTAVVQKEVTEFHNKKLLFGKALPILFSGNDAPVRNCGTYTDEELALWEEQGAFFHPNKYGYCILPIENGPCPTGNPCWIGCENDKDVGCRYLMYTPSILASMEADITLVKIRLEKALNERPNSPIVGHYQSIIRRYESVQDQFKKYT